MKKFFISTISALLLTSAFGADVCIQVITPAKNSLTGECFNYPTPCDVPEGWEKVNTCLQSSDDVIKVKSDWDLLGAKKDITNMSIFNLDCVAEIWIYDGDIKKWTMYDKQPYMSDFPRIGEIKGGRGFWIKGNSDCDIKVSTSSELILSEIDVAGKTIIYNSSEKGEFTETYYANGTMESSLLKDINMSWSIVDGKLQAKSEETFTAIPPFKFLSKPSIGTQVEADFYGELTITAIYDNIFTSENRNILLDGDNFYIKLESNPTTGYSWGIYNYDESIFKTPVRTYLSISQSDVVGVGGYDYFFFELNDESSFTNETNVSLAYAREWESKPTNVIDFYIKQMRSFSKEDTNITLTRDENEFNIKLNANLSTGYSWKVVEYDETLFDKPTNSYKVDSDLIGAGGVETWHFKLNDVNLPQKSTIKMEYAQHWEGGLSAETVEFTIYFPKNSYDINFGNTVEIDNGKLIVKFEDIIDSRCATGTECIVAGDVNVTLGVTGMLEIYEMQSFKLNETKTNAQGYSITLVGVLPYPSVNTTIDKNNYIATIEIKKPN